MDVKISPGLLLEGIINVPTSKSQTLRALYVAMLAKGVSTLKDVLDSEDTEAMLSAIQAFGVKIYKNNSILYVHSPGFKKLKAPRFIDVRNSGITLRFMAAFCGLFKTKVTLSGTTSLIKQRSVQDLESGLKRLGIKVESSHGFCPIVVQGPIKSYRTTLVGHDSQPVSALSWLLSLTNYPARIHVTQARETPWINLTFSWLKRQKCIVRHKSFKVIGLEGQSHIKPLNYNVSKDFSSSLFMIACGLLSGRDVRLKGLDFSDPQGDKKIIHLLKACGANIEFEQNEIKVSKTNFLDFPIVDVDPFIDGLPILSALALLSATPVKFVGVAGARGKESDRVNAMAQNLACLGVKTEQGPDFLVIYPSRVQGGYAEGFNDHRIVMAISLLGLISQYPVIVKGAESCSKTYPMFFDDLKKLGARVDYIS